MRAKDFYQTLNQHAIPLHFLPATLCKDGLKQIKDQARQILLGQQFDGGLGKLCFIADEAGKTSRIYIGSGDNDEKVDAMALAVKLLPEGVYVFDEDLKTKEKVAWSLAQYQFDRYKEVKLKPRVLVLSKADEIDVLPEADAIFMVRDLINTPTNDMGPDVLANVVEKLAKTHDALFEQWVGDELLHQNYPAIHAVGRAAHIAPRLLSLTWGKKSDPSVVLVGKGVCFDSGGLDIKPASGMRLMKKDMGGAAHVIGLAALIMTHRLPIHLKVLIPAVENAIDGLSYRPGDVLTMRNGLTVEVQNTDAEGRLVLADALVRASEEKPELIIDFATLTGAARVALGPDVPVFFSNDNKLSEEFLTAGFEVDEPVWRLPLHKPYEAFFKSVVADFANGSELPYGGAIVAALFLNHFVGYDIPWIHLDIMAWNIASKPAQPEGGEAMGLRAVARYLFNKYT
jgi:leucyl aminopeptidase